MQCEPPAPWRSPPPQAEHETEHRRMVVVNSEILAQRVPFSSRQWAASQRNTLAPDIVFYRPDRPVIATRLTISFRQASQWRGGRKAPTAPSRNIDPGLRLVDAHSVAVATSPLRPEGVPNLCGRPGQIATRCCRNETTRPSSGQGTLRNTLHPWRLFLNV